MKKSHVSKNTFAIGRYFALVLAMVIISGVAARSQAAPAMHLVKHVLIGTYYDASSPGASASCGPPGMERDANELRRNKRSGKIVLPCRPKFPRRDKSFFRGHFGAASISVQAIRWTPI
jgi:hypothetical protein